MWGAAASLGSGFLQAGATLWTNNQNMKLQREINERNYQAQKEFMQNGILWRKQDAERAGINPIYALGASGAQFSPSFQASNMQTPDLQFIDQAIQQREKLKLEKQNVESIVKLNEAKTKYYETLAEKGEKGTTINVNSVYKENQGREIYNNPKNSKVIDPASQITQGQAEDGIGIGIDYLFGGSTRAAQMGLDKFNKKEMKYPIFYQSKSENGRWALIDAKNFEDWLNYQPLASRISKNAEKWFYTKLGMSVKEAEQEVIRKTLEYESRESLWGLK